jgi:hypothetical protein
MSYLFLQIEGDPTIWKLSEPIDASAVMLPGQPFRATIVAPLPGALVLSCQAAVSVVLYSPLDVPGGTGATPNGLKSPTTPFVYLPSVTGLPPASPPGYPLSAGSDLAALEEDITAAMSQRTFYTVEFSDSTLVLNGATLPFVVLFPAATGS